MENIRPVSELRNNFTDISRVIKESNEPMILTKNGYADMIVLSAEAFENHNFHSEVYLKLREAELEAKVNKKRYDAKEVLAGMRTRLREEYNV